MTTQAVVSPAFAMERNAPGHDGIRAQGANRRTGQEWPIVLRV
jgi:hypothetical protein